MSELIDRQAFIENERKLYCEDCDRRKGTKNGKPNVICYEIGEAPCRACWLDDALTDLEDFPSSSPWHRVEDELPNDGDWAIFTNGKVVSVERFKEDAYNHFYPASQWFDFEDAIAWMPLPEPPKEVQE